MLVLCNKCMTLACTFERKMFQQDGARLGFFCFPLLSKFFEDSRHKNSQFMCKAACTEFLLQPLHRDLPGKLPCF